MRLFLSKNFKDNLSEVCEHIAASHDTHMVAVCLYGPRVCGYAKENTLILVVDSGALEKDVKQGWLGEFGAEKILVPYEPLFNKDYIWRQEVLFKRRIVWELLENIVLGFPESSHELLIKPEYFLYETIMQRSKLFPPVTFRFLNILRKDVKEKNVERMMHGFSESLKELTEEKWIKISDDHVRISHNFIRAIRSKRIRVPSFLRSVQRAAFFHVFSALPKMMSLLKQEEEIFMKIHREFRNEDLTLQLEDPKKYLFMPTPLGPVSLSDETTIEEFVRKNFPSGEMANIQINEMGGVLNTVYMLSFRRNHKKHKIVVKKFKDWLGFKWFPLALWALGTKSFAVLGQSRLEREYALSQFLHGQSWPVPRVLYISPKERLIFKEFVEGENFSKIIRRLLTSKEKTTEEIALTRIVGRRIAEAHRLGVALGDCKPENIIVAKDGTPYFVDLEQASRDGNQVWDIAEFLYYSGHYVSPIASADAAELIAEEFIKGYLEVEGKKETIRKAGSAE